MCAIVAGSGFHPKKLECQGRQKRREVGQVHPASRRIFWPWQHPILFRQNAQCKGRAEGSKKEPDKFRPHLSVVRTGTMHTEKCSGSAGSGQCRNAPLGRMPTLWGRISIASGYTPSALAGALPRHPLPLKARKVRYRRRGPLQNLHRSKQKENPPTQNHPHQKSSA